MTTHHVQRLIRACAMSYLAMVPAMGEESKLPADLACSTIIKSSADAAEKADWIVEGTLDDGMMPNGDQARLNLIFSNLEGLKGGWPYRGRALPARSQWDLACPAVGSFLKGRQVSVYSASAFACMEASTSTTHTVAFSSLSM